MDYEPIRAGLAKTVPLNTYLGLEIVEVAADRGVVRLPDDPRLQNHVASQDTTPVSTDRPPAATVGWTRHGTAAQPSYETSLICDGLTVKAKVVWEVPVQGDGAT